MALKDTLNKLSMATDIFDRADIIAAEIARLQLALKDEIVDCVQSLQDEGMTQKERKALIPAILTQYATANLDLVASDF